MAVAASGLQRKQCKYNAVLQCLARMRCANVAYQYIRTVASTEEDFLAICSSPCQAQLWTQVNTFQMDMNFKKVHGRSGTVEHGVIFGARVGLEAQCELLMSNSIGLH